MLLKRSDQNLRFARSLISLKFSGFRHTICSRNNFRRRKRRTDRKRDSNHSQNFTWVRRFRLHNRQNESSAICSVNLSSIFEIDYSVMRFAATWMKHFSTKAWLSSEYYEHHCAESSDSVANRIVADKLLKRFDWIVSASENSDWDCSDMSWCKIFSCSMKNSSDCSVNFSYCISADWEIQNDCRKIWSLSWTEIAYSSVKNSWNMQNILDFVLSEIIRCSYSRSRIVNNRQLLCSWKISSNHVWVRRRSRCTQCSINWMSSSSSRI